MKEHASPWRPGHRAAEEKAEQNVPESRRRLRSSWAGGGCSGAGGLWLGRSWGAASRHVENGHAAPAVLPHLHSELEELGGWLRPRRQSPAGTGGSGLRAWFASVQAPRCGQGRPPRPAQALARPRHRLCRAAAGRARVLSAPLSSGFQRPHPAGPSPGRTDLRTEHALPAERSPGHLGRRPVSQPRRHQAAGTLDCGKRTSV